MTCRHDRLRFRMWVAGALVAEDWLPGADPDTGFGLAHAHRDRANAAHAAGESWLIEVYDPDGDITPDGEPGAVVLIGSDAATQ
jgi:hypothetical protein